MSVCRFVKGMPRWWSRVRLIVWQSILPRPSVRPTTLVRPIRVVFDIARQIHVRTMLRPAHYHILSLSTRGFCMRLRDNISSAHCAARQQRCFMDHGWGRWSGRSCWRLSRRLGRLLFCFARHNHPFVRRPDPIGASLWPHCIDFTHYPPRRSPRTEARSRTNRQWVSGSGDTIPNPGFAGTRMVSHCTRQRPSRLTVAQIHRPTSTRWSRRVLGGVRSRSGRTRGQQPTVKPARSPSSSEGSSASEQY